MIPTLLRVSWTNLKRDRVAQALVFVLPILFSYSGTVVWEWHVLRITDTGLHQGLLFSLRLIFLILISVWIGVTEPSKLSEELAWILSPLKYFHFSVNRIPRLTSLSLSFLPVVWERLARVKPKTLTNILDALAAFFIGLDQDRYGSSEGEGPEQERRPAGQPE
jgi:energy-coupling factor transporter transmembrane protein EcfT